MLNQLKKDLEKAADKEKKILLQGFFKTEKGEYGEGDVFLGVMVPQQREIAGKYKDLSIKEVQKLLSSRIHEHRLTVLFIMIHKYEKAKKEKKVKNKEKIKKRDNDKVMKEIVDIYLKNTKHINNWDLVDLSAPRILGDYIFNNKSSKNIMYKFAKSKDLWKKRIAILATAWFIRNNQFDDTLKICSVLLKDKHDLIHKATGWMLREVGKKNQAIEEKFLKKHYKNMPRTMLRYAIERFDENKKKFYMKK